MLRKTLRKFCQKIGSESAGEKSIPGFATRNDIIDKINEKPFVPIIGRKSIFTEEYFQEKGEHLRVIDTRIEPSPYSNIITGYTSKQILVNDVAYPGPVVVTKDQVFMWELLDFQYLRPQHFEILNVLHPKPNHILISSGETLKKLPADVMEYLQKYELKVDVVDIFLASGTYNICMEQSTDTIGFFWLK